MAESFDAYHEWLGIAPKDQPPNHYQLLGIDLYESNANVIDNAANRQMAHLRTFQTGGRSTLCQQLLNEVRAARVLLFDEPNRAIYDAELKQKYGNKPNGPQPRVVRALPLSPTSAPPVARGVPMDAATAQPAPATPQIESGPDDVSHRHRRRSKSTSLVVLGVGAAVLCVVGISAAVALYGGDDEDDQPQVVTHDPKKPSPPPNDEPSDPTKPDVPDEGSKTGEITGENTDNNNAGTKTGGTSPEIDSGVSEPPKLAAEEPINPLKLDDKTQIDPVTPVPVRPATIPVPDTAAQKAAEKEIRSLFDFDAAKSHDDITRLARTVFTTALDSSDDPASQYVMLRMVRDLTAKDGDYGGASMAIDRMSKRFEIDATVMRCDAVVQSLGARITPKWRAQLVKAALKLVGECHQADRYREAEPVLSAVVRAAGKLHDVKISMQARKLKRTGKAMAKLYAEVRVAFDALKKTPDDPESNTKAGKYVCFVKADWKRGLAMLAKGNDAVLKDLAVRELRGVKDTDEQVAMGDAWWEVADQQPAHAVAEVVRHAKDWYRRALRRLTGLDKLKVQKRLEETKTQHEKSLNAAKTETRDIVRSITVLKSLREFQEKHGANFPIRNNRARGGLAKASSAHARYNPPQSVFAGNRDKNTWCLKGTSGQFLASWKSRPQGQYIIIFGRPSNKDSWGDASVSINGLTAVSLSRIRGHSVTIIELTRRVPISSILLSIKGTECPGMAALEIH